MSFPPRLLLALALIALPSAAAVPPVTAPAGVPDTPPRATSQAAITQALDWYEEGKRAADTGDHRAALRAYSQASILDPANPRWQFQLGLTLRQLGHLRAARDAFLAAGRLDPDYRRVEIAQNLRAMGLDGNNAGRPVSARDEAIGRQGLPLDIVLASLAALLLGGGSLLLLRRRRRAGDAGDAPLPAAQAVALAEDAAAAAAQARRLERLAPRLIRAEQAMLAGEDIELRVRLDRATELEQLARQQLAAVGGGRGLALAAASTGLDEAESVADEIETLLAERPPRARAADELAELRRGCWFCARPLANPDYPRLVPLLSADQRIEVLACPPCAALVDSGASPPLLVLGAPPRQLHWSEDPAYAPCRHRHQPPPQAQLIAAWQLQPQRPLAELAQLAAGAAVNPAAAAALFAAARARAAETGATHGLDLAAPRRTTAATPAAGAAAPQPS